MRAATRTISQTTISLLLALMALMVPALASGLVRPRPPAPRDARELDCPRAYDVADPCEATCLPKRDALEVLDQEDYLVELEAYASALELELHAAELERDAALLEADRWREEAMKPGPLLRQPGVGLVAGVGLCVGSGWAIGQAAGR